MGVGAKGYENQGTSMQGDSNPTKLQNNFPTAAVVLRIHNFSITFTKLFLLPMKLCNNECTNCEPRNVISG